MEHQGRMKVLTVRMADGNVIKLEPYDTLPSTTELARRSEELLHWKKTTSYTVLKRLCDKGCLKNEAAVVTALVDQSAVQQADGQEVLQRSFGGSLPNFMAAFLKAGSVSDQDAAAIEKMLEDYRNHR